MYVTEIEQDDKTFSIERQQQKKIERKKMKTQVDAFTLDIIIIHFLFFFLLF